MVIAMVAVTAIPIMNPTHPAMIATRVVGLISRAFGRVGSGGGSGPGMLTSSRTVRFGGAFAAGVDAGVGSSSSQPSGTDWSNRVGGSSEASCSGIGGSRVVGRAMPSYRAVRAWVACFLRSR